MSPLCKFSMRGRWPGLKQKQPNGGYNSDPRGETGSHKTLTGLPLLNKPAHASGTRVSSLTRRSAPSAVTRGGLRPPRGIRGRGLPGCKGRRRARLCRSGCTRCSVACTRSQEAAAPAGVYPPEAAG